MNLTIPNLCAIAPGARPNAAAIIAALNPAMDRFAINTKRRAAHFLGQLAHESRDFTAKRENLNYRSYALLETFNTPKLQRFTREQAELYGRTPSHPADQEMIANIAYANRMGNGDIASGDGWRNRGAGWIQLTGADNLNACADFFHIPRDTVAAWLCTPTGAAMGAAWFWQLNNLSELADRDDIDGIADRINIGRATPKYGDAIGFSARLMLTNIARQVLA
jgi:putative chitinase